jgi:hypothetical protein
MSFLRRLSLLRESRSPDEHAHPIDELHEQVSSLETEMAESARTLADLMDRAAEAERRAMDAIRSTDDRAARTALLEHQAFAERAAAVAADLKVLRAILDECYEFESRLLESQSRQQ